MRYKKILILATLVAHAAFAQIPGNRAQAKNSRNQFIPTNTYTPLTFDTNIYDNSGIHTPGTSEFIVPAGLGGVWLAWGQVAWFSSASPGSHGIGISINDNIAQQNTNSYLELISYALTQTISAVLVLNDFDRVRFVVVQGTGSSLGANISSYGGMIKLQ